MGNYISGDAEDIPQSPEEIKERLMDMGFDETIAILAVDEHPNNIPKAVNYSLKKQKVVDESKQSEKDKQKTLLAANKHNMTVITKFEWGEIRVNHNGKKNKFKDCVITPNGVKEWNWKEDGTKHKPGITLKAIIANDLLKEVDYIILSRGFNEKLQTKKVTRQLLEEAKTDGTIKGYEILQSEDAVEKYSQLVKEGHKVSGLFHSTC